MIRAAALQPFDAELTAGTPGRAGAMTVEVYDPATAASLLGPTSVGISEPRPGSYHFVGVAPAIPGDYLLRWTDTVDDVSNEEELTVTLTPTPAPTATVATIGTVDELRRYLHTAGGGGAAEDDLLADLLAAAGDRFLSLVPDRTLIPTPAPRDAGEGADPRYVDDLPPVTYPFPTRGRTIQVPDLRSVDEITIDGTPYTGTYNLRGRRGEPALWLRLGAEAGIGVPGVLVPATTGVGFYDASDVDRTVAITGRWGPVSVAPRVREAVLIWAARVYHERAARWSDARQDPEGGVASYFRRIPPSIEAVVNGLKVPGV